MILDGNRRWARSKGLLTLLGHKAGFEAGMKIAEAARSWGVHTFTVWGSLLRTGIDLKRNIILNEAI